MGPNPTVPRKSTRRRVKPAVKPQPRPAAGRSTKDSAPGNATENIRLLHELQVQQIELEAQNRELREAHWLLECSRDSYADLYDFAPVGYVKLDAQGIILEINLPATVMLGAERRHLVGTPLHLRVAREDLGRFRGHLAGFSEPEQRAVTELTLVRKGRDDLPVLLQSVVIPDTSPGFRYRTAITDLTERKQAERALRDNEARLHAVLETAVDAIITFSETGVIESFNRAAERLFGYASAEAVGQSVMLLMPSPMGEGRAGPASHFRAFRDLHVLGAGREVSGRRKDGSTFPIDLSLSEVPLADRRIYTGFVRDITGLRRDELRRRVQYEVASLLAASGTLDETLPKLLSTVAGAFEGEVGEFWEVRDSTPLLHRVQVWRKPGKHLPARNRAGDEWVVSLCDGLPHRVVETRKPEWIPDLSQCRPFRHPEIAAHAGLHSGLAFPILSNDHVLGVMAFLASQIMEPDEDLWRTLSSLCRQIGQFMERRRAEEALFRRQQEFKALTENSPDAIARLDRQLRYLYMNRTAEGKFGVKVADCRGKTRIEAGLPASWATVSDRKSAQVLATGEEQSFEASTLVDGERRHYCSRLVPEFGPDGSLETLLSITSDVTDRYRLEQEILEITDREQRRIGQDLHDGLGQQLTAIQLMCESLREDLAVGHPLLEKQAARMAVYLSETIAQTRALSHGLAPMELQTSGLMVALERLARDTGALAKVKCRFRCAKPVLMADNVVSGHLYRIAQEAVNNALKHGAPGQIEIRLDQRKGLVQLQISNNGKELSETGETSRGIGLQVMQHRANIVGGTLTIGSAPGQGVTVTCTVPVRKP